MDSAAKCLTLMATAQSTSKVFLIKCNELEHQKRINTFFFCLGRRKKAQEKLENLFFVIKKVLLTLSNWIHSIDFFLPKLCVT